jgi:hypothetical protein
MKVILDKFQEYELESVLLESSVYHGDGDLFCESGGKKIPQFDASGLAMIGDFR